MRGKIFIAVVSVWCVAAIAAPAHAASVGSLMYTDGATLNLASDNDAQRLQVDLNQNGLLDPGDVMRGVIDINTLNSTPANLGGTTGNNEWTALFEIVCIGKVQTGPATWSFRFAPSMGFPGWLAALDPFAPPAPAGTMVRFYEDSTPDADFTMSLAVAYDTAGPSFVGGPVPTASVFWDLGFQGVLGEGWVGAGSDAIAMAPIINPGTVVGNSNFALSLLANPSGYGVVPQPMDVATAAILGLPPGTPADLIGSSAVRGALQSTAGAGFHLDSDANLTFLAVPLPAAVYPGMVMLGLLGIGSYRRWRRSDRV